MLTMEWAWLIPVYSFSAFGIVALFGKYLPMKGAFVSILAILAGFITFWPMLFDLLDSRLPHEFGSYHFVREWFSTGNLDVSWGIIVDPLSVSMLGLVTLVALGVQVYSLGYMRGDPRFGWYFAVHALFAASMLTLVIADNLLLLYAVWELVGLCSYLLIGFWYERRSAAEAAKKAFITTRIGDVGLLIGILLLFMNTGTFDISETIRMVTDPLPGEAISNTVLVASALLIFLGAMGKSAQFPLHVWLPDAMEGPTPVSALIHAATMVIAGVFLIGRLFPLYEAVPNVQIVIAIIGLTTAMVGASLALVTTDLKRILAYSTISHLGFMMLALGAGGLTAAIFHLIAHGVAKALLFLGAGSIMHAMKDETDIRKMGGLLQKMPITAVTFIIGALALAGIPPLSGFFSKDEIFVAVSDGLNPIFLILLLVTSVISALYMARAVRLVFFGQQTEESRHAHESPIQMTGPLVVFAAITLVLGFTALDLSDNFGGFGAFVYDHAPHPFEFNPLLAFGGIVLAAGGFLVGWLLYAGPPATVESLRTRFAGIHRLLEHKLYIDEGYQWAIDNVALRTARFIALFDRRAINDGAVNGSGNAVYQAGLKLRYHVTGKLYNYGAGMVLGVVVIVILLWVQPF